MKKKILIVTERRADYSKFRPIIKQLSVSDYFEYELIVTGSHLLSEHGDTINEIKHDGFKITATFPMYDSEKKDVGSTMTRAFGNAVIHLSNIIEKLKPDIIFTGFDIGANLAAAIVGAHMNTVVVHLEGGEVTGTIDEPIRHATTKFAHIHFTTNSVATERLKKLGEDPKFIFTVGNPSLDEILQVEEIPKDELTNEFKIDFSKPYVILIQHSVTSELVEVDSQISKSLEAIKEMNLQAIIIYGNADAGSKKIHEIIKNSKIKYFGTVPFKKYINLLRNATALVGNSSSGIMEAPFLHIPTVNIGTRQNGRLRAQSVIDVNYNKEEIKNAILKTINDQEFLSKIKNQENLYGDGSASKKIIDILTTLDLSSIPIQKKLTY